MKQKTNITKLILLAAVSLGSVVAIRAQDAMKAPPNPADEAVTGYGLLGSSYAGASFDYYQLNRGAPRVAHGYSFTDRTVIDRNLDATFDYDWTGVRSAAGASHRNRFAVGGASYAVTGWGKPFVEAGAGWRWDSAAGTSASSFRYRLASGVEFKLAQRFAVAPYVAFDRATRFNQNETGYGLRANFRINRTWDIALRSEYQDVSHTSADRTVFSLGGNYHF